MNLSKLQSEIKFENCTINHSIDSDSPDYKNVALKPRLNVDLKVFDFTNQDSIDNSNQNSTKIHVPGSMMSIEYPSYGSDKVHIYNLLIFSIVVKNDFIV